MKEKDRGEAYCAFFIDSLWAFLVYVSLFFSVGGKGKANGNGSQST